MTNKNKKPQTQHQNQDDTDSDFDTFMQTIEAMDPKEAQTMIQGLIATMEEEGEHIPFPMRLMASDVLFGLAPTPVGLAYGIGALGQLILTGFITQDDIEEFGSAEDILTMVIEDFEEFAPIAATVRDDKTIGDMIDSALKGTFQVSDDFFDCMETTDLQRAVWKELTRIPYGGTISYEELAKRVGKPKAVRAVASAVGENPICLAIPCHRVIRKSGEFGEYHWGSDIKEKLLAYEQAHKKT